MQLLSANIQPTCEIVLHGDTHFGNPAAARKRILTLIKWIEAKKNRYFVHMGDEIEAIATDDKRYQHIPGGEPIPLQQMKDVANMYSPIADRCLVWLKGNHTQKLHRVGDLTRTLCEDYLNVPYGTWTCKLQLRDPHGESIAKMYLTHGFHGTIRSRAKDHEQRMANMKASLKMQLIRKAADCLIMAMGHTHLLMVVNPARQLVLVDDGKKLVQAYMEAGDGSAKIIEPDRRWYVNTGSFLRTFLMDDDTYAERAGYDPIEIGYAVVSIVRGKVAGVTPVVVT